MAITQVTTETVDGVVIGLSDTIGNLISNGDFTVENLTPYMICGQLNKLCPKYGSFAGAERSYNGNAGSLPAQFPNVNTGSAGGVTVEFAQDDNLALPHDMYGRNILIYGSLGTPQIYAITNDMTTSNLRVVTSIDFKKIYYDVDMAGVSVSFTRPDAKTITNYQSGSDGKIKTVDNDEDTDISVFSVVDDGNNASWYCLIDDLFPKSNSYGVRWLQNTPQYMAGAYDSTYATLNDGWSNFTLDKTLWRWSEPAGYLIYGGDGGNWGESFVGYIDNGNNFYAYLNYTPYGGTMQCIADGLDYALNQLANVGLKFRYNNTWFKPLGQGGVIYGYTDDMTKTSEWDNITNVTGNTVPVTPSTPPTPDADDNEIDVNMGQFAPSQCFVNYIELSSENMIKLASGFNAYNASIWNIGGDLMKNLVSYKIFAVYGTHSGTIKNVSIGGHEIQYDNAPINGNYIDDMGTVDLGSIEIGSKFRFNDWRDYAPYTKIECYVPCCGWCQLPPWCMGRTVTGTLYIDVANGSCKAVIKAGRTPVAEIGGCVAMDVPFSSVATGAKAAGIITAITNGAVAAFNPTPQNLISGSFGILSSLNANYTETKGVMGDGSNINGCTEFLIKVTRPASTDTGNGEITNRYKHEKGIPCAKTKTLASGQGFTQITDANINGAMTDREKQMIIDGFRHGLIL